MKNVQAFGSSPDSNPNCVTDQIAPEEPPTQHQATDHALPKLIDLRSVVELADFNAVRNGQCQPCDPSG